MQWRTPSRWHSLGLIGASVYYISLLVGWLMRLHNVRREKSWLANDPVGITQQWVRCMAHFFFCLESVVLFMQRRWTSWVRMDFEMKWKDLAQHRLAGILRKWRMSRYLALPFTYYLIQVSEISFYSFVKLRLEECAVIFLKKFRSVAY
jgi:hypothetical protein